MYLKEVNMQPADILALPSHELDKLRLIEYWKKGVITQVKAAATLKLSERHFRRLVRRYETLGMFGLINKRKGKPPGNRLPETLREQSLQIIRDHFYDYGPTLAAEKLAEYFDIQVSRETVRRWMIAANLWIPKQKKIPRPHPLRPRRPYLGELVQVDGSHHHWFEERGPKACLLVFIDDATGKLLNLRFAPGETTIDYLDTLKEYLKSYGVPRAMYFDKHNVFHINQKITKAKDGVTQFGRVMKHLNIEPIYAHSPQAKGRVERANETLQDRLVKELRFLGIDSIEKANQHLPGFIQRFNEQFAKPPEEPLDLHRALTAEEQASLDYFCAIQTIKTVSKDLLIKHNGQVFKVIPPKNRPNRIIRQKVMMCEDLSGTRFYFNNKLLEYQVTSKGNLTGPTLNRKNMDQYMDALAKMGRYWTLTY